MAALMDNLASLHLWVWGFTAAFGALLGAFVGLRAEAMGTVVLILGILMWSMFIGLIPIINHAISPDGLSGIFAGRGFGQFLEDAAPQAIFSETRSHRIEVVQSAVIGAVTFAAIGLISAVVLRGGEDG